MAENFREALPLVGYMDERQARDFLSNDCVLDPPADPVELARACREAAGRKALPDLDARVQELPPEVGVLLGEVEKDQRFAGVVKGWPWSFRELEIDKLVAVQRYIDLAYVDAISRKLDLGTAVGRARFCLTDEFRVRESEYAEVPPALTFAVKGHGQDLRVMRWDSTLDSVTGERTVSLTVGWGQPFVQVAKLGGRYVLKNGYHRAFALRKMGFRYLPCILVEVDGYPDLECTGPPTFFGAETVLGERAPVMASFFDPEVAPRVRMRSYDKAVVIRPDFTLLEPAALERYLGNELGRPEVHGGAKLTYADVRAVREDWNVYELPDGTALKLRVVVTRVNRRRPGSSSVPDISNVMMVCNPPENAKGPPMLARPTPEELTGSIVDPDVRFRTLSEPVNEYVADDGTRVILRLRLYSLARTRMYDAKGDPMYLFNARPEVTTVGP